MYKDSVKRGILMLNLGVKSNRVSDSQQEKIVNSFVYQYLFNKISKNVLTINDKHLQIAGVDVIVDGKKIWLDEFNIKERY